MKRGRPKGYSPYVEVSYQDLSDYVGKKTLIKVCKTWMEDLVIQNRQESNFIENLLGDTEQQPMSYEQPKTKIEQPKIEYELTTFE
jgi:hypothetical protein